jgi:hypothetical protein
LFIFAALVSHAVPRRMDGVREEVRRREKGKKRRVGRWMDR